MAARFKVHVPRGVNRYLFKSESCLVLLHALSSALNVDEGIIIIPRGGVRVFPTLLLNCQMRLILVEFLAIGANSL